jgi:uracil-DNA glycosylase
LPESLPDAEPLLESWNAALAASGGIDAIRAIERRVEGEERAGHTIYPPRGLRLAALRLTEAAAVKVVILGQDPYHGPDQAHGLAFSVPPGVRVPPSLANVYKELEADLGIARPRHGHLDAWARQGVLLLNTTLTVEAGAAGSHGHLGWQAITDAIVDIVASGPSPSVFMLWGNHARRKAERIEAVGEGRHLVLTAAHPSPLSARTGFFGCRHFSRANAFLVAHGRGAIDWRLEP